MSTPAPRPAAEHPDSSTADVGRRAGNAPVPLSVLVGGIAVVVVVVLALASAGSWVAVVAVAVVLAAVIAVLVSWSDTW